MGDIGEAIAIADFTKAGAIVSKPLSNNARYDIIIDINGKLFRVQVKTTSSVKEDKMVFATKTTNYVKGEHKSVHYTKEEVDMFYFYCAENDWRGLYLITDEVIPTEMRIRLVPPKNGQIKGVKMAEDYEFLHQFKNIQSES